MRGGTCRCERRWAVQAVFMRLHHPCAEPVSGAACALIFPRKYALNKHPDLQRSGLVGVGDGL